MLDTRSLREAVAQRGRAALALAWPAKKQFVDAPVSARTLPLRPIVRQALIWWAGIRAGYLVLTVLVILVLRHQTVGLEPILLRWSEWDAHWYLIITTQGYAYPATAGFFPLYPMLTSLVMRLPGMSSLLAAVLVANAASLGAMFGLAWLAALESGNLRRVPTTLGALAAYPLAYFLVAPFSEGLFLCCSVFALLCARQGWWHWAAVCAFLTGLTRPTSIVLAPALVWEYGRQQGWWTLLRQRVQSWREHIPSLGAGWQETLRPQAIGMAMLAAAAVPLAFGAITLYDWRHFGDPLLYVHAQDTYWHHVQWPLWRTLAAMAGTVLHPPHSMLFRMLVVIDFSALLGAVVLMVGGLRRLPFAFSLYLLAMYFLLLSAPNPARPEVVPALARYTLVAFPLFLLLGAWGEGHPRIWPWVVAVGLALQVVLGTLFLQGIDVE